MMNPMGTHQIKMSQQKLMDDHSSLSERKNCQELFVAQIDLYKIKIRYKSNMRFVKSMDKINDFKDELNDFILWIIET